MGNLTTRSGAQSNWPDLLASPNRPDNVLFQTINQQGEVTGEAPTRELAKLLGSPGERIIEFKLTEEMLQAETSRKRERFAAGDFSAFSSSSGSSTELY